MKFCIVTRNVIRGDGQGKVNYEIIKESLRRGHQVTIFSDGLDLDLQKEPNLTWVPAQAEKFPTAFLHQFVFGRRSESWLRKNRHQFDLVQSCGAVTPAHSDVNTVHFVHSAWVQSAAHPLYTSGNYAYGLYQWVYSKLNASLEKQAFQKTKQVIAVSEMVRQDLISIGVPRSLTEVIHNGVDIEEFIPGPADRTKLGLPLNVSLALFAGDIRTSRKNLDSVLKALKLVPDLHLAVIGGTDGSPYPAMAKELKVDHRVHFLGFRKDVAEVMRACDFFVFPSRYDTCALVLIEAMASGLPVITATSTGGSELVTGNAGFVLSDSEDVNDITTHLKLLTQDLAKRQSMGYSARQVAETHSWVSKARRYVDIFEDVARKQSYSVSTSIPNLA